MVQPSRCVIRRGCAEARVRVTGTDNQVVGTCLSTTEVGLAIRVGHAKATREVTLARSRGEIARIRLTVRIARTVRPIHGTTVLIVSYDQVALAIDRSVRCA